MFGRGHALDTWGFVLCADGALGESKGARSKKVDQRRLMLAEPRLQYQSTWMVIHFHLVIMSKSASVPSLPRPLMPLPPNGM